MHQVCVISLKLQAPIGIVSTRIEAHVLSLFQLDINSEAWTRPKQGCVRVGHVSDTATCPTRVEHVLTVSDRSQQV